MVLFGRPSAHQRFTASPSPFSILSNRGSRAAAVGASHPAAGAGRDMAGVHRRGYSRAYGAMVLVLASMQWAGLRGAAAFQLLQHARGSLQQRRQQAVRARGLLRAAAAGDGEPRKRVVFLGTPEVAARSLELLLQASRQGRGGGFDIVSVVTQPPAPSGRKLKLTPSPVQTLAEAEGLPVLTPEKAKDPAFLERLQASRPDLCITAAYGQFLPTPFLSIPRLGTLNIHPSLLPRWRGASPVQRTLEAGDAETGVSVLFTVLKMDAGPILRQVKRPLQGDEKAPELLLELFEAGTEALVEALPSVWDGTASPAPQDEGGVTKADKISAAEAALDFSVDSARVIHNRVRGFAVWPGTWSLFELEGEEEPVRLKVVTTRVVAEGEASPAASKDGGLVELVGKKALRLTCSDGSALDLLEVQPPGKKVMEGRAFANGLRGRALRWRPFAGALAAAAKPA